MKILVSDKLAPEGLEILKKAPGGSVDYKTGLRRLLKRVKICVL